MKFVWKNASGNRRTVNKILELKCGEGKEIRCVPRENEVKKVKTNLYSLNISLNQLFAQALSHKHLFAVFLKRIVFFSSPSSECMRLSYFPTVSLFPFAIRFHFILSKNFFFFAYIYTSVGSNINRIFYSYSLGPKSIRVIWDETSRSLRCS